MIDEKHFKTVIEFTPLVSIDLVITNTNKQLLLGFRNNEPAKNYWFVPGGRIYKDESIQSAFDRILEIELGIQYEFKMAKHLGLYEHFYNTNRLHIENISTHYVVNAFHLNFADEISFVMDDQHADIKWFDLKTILNDPTIHDNTKAYLNSLDF